MGNTANTEQSNLDLLEKSVCIALEQIGRMNVPDIPVPKMIELCLFAFLIYEQHLSISKFNVARRCFSMIDKSKKSHEEIEFAKNIVIALCLAEGHEERA